MTFLSSSQPEQCEIFGDFGWFIQGTLGLLSFSSLIVKRYLEKNPRTWKIWFFDASKQAVSSGLLHTLNLFLSSSAGSENQCTWYFLNFSIDTVLGMALCYLLLHGIEKCLNNFRLLSFKSGYYGEIPDVGMWVYQLFIWISIILSVKAIIWVVMVLFKQPLQFFGDVILFPFKGYPQIELVMVMVFIPLVLNSLIFWITDSFLKSDKETAMDFDLELLPESQPKLINTINI